MNSEDNTVLIRIKEAMKAQAQLLHQDSPVSDRQNAPRKYVSRWHDLDKEIENVTIKWNVTADRPLSSHRQGIGPWVLLFKRAIRRCLRWYINPVTDQQRDFNGSVTRSIYFLRDMLEEQTQELERQKALNQQLQQLAEKQQLLNRQGLEALHAVAADNKHHPLAMDYLQFENRFRGSRADIQKRQQFYLDYFRGRNQVIDLGCGRGEFVELLITNGINAVGVDLDPDMIGFCRQLGLPVMEGEALEYLSGQADHSLEGIFCAQLVEHLRPEDILRLVHLCYQKLQPDGVLVIETINPQTLFALANWFYIDPTHFRPVHPETLRFIFEAQGFSSIQALYLSPAEERFVPSLQLEQVNGNLEEFNQALQQLNQVVFGPQDYALIGHK